jgi:hypothetical protein
MHVQTTTSLDDRLHHRLLPSEGDRDAAGTFKAHFAWREVRASPFSFNNGAPRPRCLAA